MSSLGEEYPNANFGDLIILYNMNYGFESE
jgi:hypothetical protein